MNQETKKRTLTDKQEQVYEIIRLTKGGYLKPHRKPNGDKCWKLMDEKQNPIRIFGEGIIDRIIEKDYLKKQDHIIVLNDAA